MINVKAEDVPKCAVQYPYVGQWSHNEDLLVLFIAYECGVILRESPNSDQVGTYSDTLAEGEFRPYEGTVTLENI
jgi:hypothetical protein